MQVMVDYRIRYERATVILARSVDEEDIPVEGAVIQFPVEGKMRRVRIVKVGPMEEITDEEGPLRHKVQVEGRVI